MNTKKTNGKDTQHVRPGVMLAVADPENAENLAAATYKICKTFNAGVHIIHVHPGNPSSTEDAPLPDVAFPLNSLPLITSNARYDRSISKGIISAVKEEGTQLLIIGWHGRRKDPKLKYGTTVDPIIEQAPCDVIVLKNYVNKDYFDILIPLAGGPNSGLALEIGSILAEKEAGKITLLTVNKLITTGKKKAVPDLNLQSFLENHIKRLHLPEKKVSIRSIATRENIPDIIIREAAGHDMVVMGSRYNSLLNRSSSDAIPEIVANSLELPLVIVKAEQSLISLVKKLF